MSLYETKKLKEERGEIIAKMQEMAQRAEAEDRSFTPEEREQYRSYQEEEKSYREKLETRESIDYLRTLDKQSAAPVQRRIKPERDAELSLRSYFGKNKEFYSDEWTEAAQRMNFNPNAESLKFQLLGNADLIQLRQQSLTAGEGGRLVNDGVVHGFERALKAYWSWSDLVDVIRTANGEPYPIVTANDTSNEGAYNAELVAAVNVNHTFNRYSLGAHKITSGIFPVSNEVLQDSSQSLMTILSDSLAERIGRKLAREITNGDGEAGHLTGFTESTTSAGSASFIDGFSDDDIIDLFFSVDEAYRNNPKCAFMMHSLTLATLMKLKDTTGRSIFQSYSGGMNEAPRMTLYGKPVYLNDYLNPIVPGVSSAGEAGIYFGDWSKVKVRIVRDLEVRTSNEKYWLEDAVAAKATVRVDSKLLDAGGNPIKHLVMAPESGGASILD